MPREDKILNNSYNSGELNFEFFDNDIKIDPKVEDKYKEYSSENIIELRTFELLNERIYEIFQDSPYLKKYSQPKKVDKKDMYEMFYYFKEHLEKENTYTTMEIFIVLAEFFQINYKYLYNEISVSDKEDILKELNEKYNIENKMETKKLF